jgi:hypothetical protein
MITVRKCKEHPDGSATCEFVFDKEDLHILLRHGLVAVLTLGKDMYKPVFKKPAKKVAKKVVKKVAKKKAK